MQFKASQRLANPNQSVASGNQNDELCDPVQQAQVDRDAIIREMRSSLVMLAPEDRDVVLRELNKEVEQQSQHLSQLDMCNETPAKKISKRGRGHDSDDEERETPSKRPRSRANKKLFSSQDAEMERAFLDVTITPQMQHDSDRLMTFLVEAEEKEKGDVYLVCDGDRILYIGHTLQLALRFYLHLTSKSKKGKGPIHIYKDSHPDHALTVVRLFENGTTPVISSLKEALIIYLAKELELKLIVEVDGEEMELDDAVRNKRKERIPPALLQKLNNLEERQIIINGLKCDIRKAMTRDVRVTEEDAKEAWKIYMQQGKSDPEVKAKLNLKDAERMRENYANEEYMEKDRAAARAKYHNNGPGEVWTKSIPTLVDASEIVDRSGDLAGLLREIPEDLFAESVTNSFTAHKFAARYGLIVNSMKCAKFDCLGENGLPREMKFRRNGKDCGFDWVCRFPHPTTRETVTHSYKGCCADSILKIDRAGGLYNILRMLHKRAHGKNQAEIFHELGLQALNDKNDKAASQAAERSCRNTHILGLKLSD
uniref:Uncharacterized protein n=1 Tax=Panagrolaimus sp. ES5 TaxID=591445 RepID=A0AC34F878_9BILA